MQCLWCRTSIKKVGGQFGVPLHSVVSSEAAEFLQHKYGRGKVCRVCSDTITEFQARCDLGLAAHPDLAALLAGSVAARSSDSEVVVHMDDGPVQVPAVQGRYYPLSLFKQTCNPHWTRDRRWLAMRDSTHDKPPAEQIITVKRFMALPFGTRPPFPKPRIVQENIEMIKGLFDDQQRSTMQCCHKLWGYLTNGLDAASPDGNDAAFTATFMLRFLIDECSQLWDAKWTYILKLTFEKLWSTGFGPIATINHIFDSAGDRYLIELSRQAPKPHGKAESQAAQRNARLSDGKESQYRQATIAGIIVFYSALGCDLLSALKAHPLYALTPRSPLAICFLLCELRKNAQTGSTRCRQGWTAERQSAFIEAMSAQHPNWEERRVVLKHKGVTWQSYLDRE